QWSAAEDTAKAAMEVRNDSFLAHWVIAQVLRDRGETMKADEEFRWFIRAYNDKDVTDPDEMLLIGLAALERARLHHLNDQYQFVVDELFNEAVKKDKDYWPALYEKGKLFLDKHNKAQA